jgi:nucleotide-binding universal stress UspA family protein
MLVQLDLGRAAGPRIALSADLARRFGARLIGAAAQPLVLPYLGDGAATMDSILVENARGVAAEDLAKAERLFGQNTQALQDTEWRVSIEPAGPFLLAQARAADLVIVGGRGDGSGGEGDMGAAPGDVVLELGRPLLVVPPGIARLDASRVVIAWKDTKEARRAVRDALPLLARAEAVSVLSLGAEAAEQGADDVVAYLARHAIPARSVLRRQLEDDLTDEITGFARDQAADLIVCGAYGRGRVQEWLFGGVTRDLLQRTPVCCLMSH